MNKKTRDWLFGIFVGLFVIITIILSLIATGYRFNLSWPLNFNRVLQKTGTIALDSDPKGAKITITGEQKKGFTLTDFFNKNKELTTPVKIKNLLPGEYVVSFELDGYWPYEKKLRVNATQTTFLENIILFKKGSPLKVVDANQQEIEYSPNNGYVWLKKDNKIISLKTEEVIHNNTSSQITWTNVDKQIFDGAKLVNLETNATTDYQAAIGSPEQAQIQGNKIVYLEKGNLTIYNTSDKLFKAVTSQGTILLYKTNENNILAIVKDDKKIKLNAYSLDNGLLTDSTELLFEAKQYVVEQDNNNHLTILDKDHETLYLINLKNKLEIISIIRGVGAYQWKNNDQIFYATGAEIYLYDLKQDKAWLMNRLSEKINSLAWSNDNNYLVFASLKNIGIIDLSDNRNDITGIWGADNISALKLDDKNQILFFYSLVGNQSGLYKINLR
jgi:hypothetical protein